MDLVCRKLGGRTILAYQNMIIDYTPMFTVFIILYGYQEWNLSQGNLTFYRSLIDVLLFFLIHNVAYMC